MWKLFRQIEQKKVLYVCIFFHHHTYKVIKNILYFFLKYMNKKLKKMKQSIKKKKF